MFAKRLLVVMCVAAVGACTLDKQSAPDLTGPSGLALNLDVRATPDALTRDGVSQSTISVTATNGAGQVVSGLGLRFTVSPNLGSVTPVAGSTNSSGRATVTYTAPGEGGDTTTTITVTPVSTNYQNTVARTITIRLYRPIS